VHPALASRLKSLGRLDIAEKRRPQDGRIKTQRGDHEVELRVSSLPVAFGEKMVIRILNPTQMVIDLEGLGMFAEHLSAWRRLAHQPTGLIIVSGPTGSGKTTTLYSTLAELATPEVNITTVEDPIEMVREEFNQVLVQRKIDVTYANALRTILRQDPDIVMIGEIRDSETASMAVQAALTGHLVLSTLHTNDAATVVTRLLDLDVEPFLLASTLTCALAQRVVRKICDSCRAEDFLTSEQVELLEINLPRGARKLPVKYGEGCLRCRNTGYYGRTGVFELLEVDDNLRRLITERAGTPDIRRAARANGTTSLRECAIKKLAQGTTTFEEVMSIPHERA
jgi:general secretion pathway protein E